MRLLLSQKVLKGQLLSVQGFCKPITKIKKQLGRKLDKLFFTKTLILFLILHAMFGSKSFILNYILYIFNHNWPNEKELIFKFFICQES